MKKNVVFIVLDSFLYSKIGNTCYGPSPTPFLDTLIPKSVFLKNLYAQGPYTEAGNRALLTGSDSLTYGGYMHNLNEARDIYLDVFKDNCYYNIEFFLPYYLYSEQHFKSIDKQFFTSDFVFNSVWSNRLKHFADIQKTEALTKEDYRDITEQLRLTFESWLNFLDNTDRVKYKYIERIVEGYDFEESRQILKREQERFNTSPKVYADEVLDKGSNHILFTIPLCKYEKYIDEQFIAENVYKKHSSLIRSIILKQFILNIKNQKISIKKIINSLFQKDNRYLRSLAFSLGSGMIAKQFKTNTFCQLLPSCRKLLRGVVEEFESYNGSNPIMIHVHPEELHNTTSFLTYDINDEGLLNQELSLYEQYVNEISTNYKGEIVYDLALLYVDDCIREMYESLETKGLLDNTVLVVTSDHGFSYDCVPLRQAFVNNHHTENYHIPAIFFDGGLHKGSFSDYHTSKDVLPTIYELCGISAPESINGNSIFNSDYTNKYAISEYLGGGCPDMRRRPIHYMIRDDNWLVVYYVTLMEDFRSGEVVELYDLRKDKDEMCNLKGRIKEDNYSYLLEELEKHHIFLQNNQSYN